MADFLSNFIYLKEKMRGNVLENVICNVVKKKSQIVERLFFLTIFSFFICLIFGKCAKPDIYEQAFLDCPENLKDSVKKRDFLLKARVGHLLFFDANLSINQTKSCASCHNPNLYFTDGYRRTLGVYADVQMRNTPSVLNLVNAKGLNWADPHVTTFQQQMQVPLFSKAHFEMGMESSNLEQAIKILSDMQYAHFSFSQNQKNWNYIVDCISCYLCLLSTRNAPFDEYLATGKGISADAVAGFKLFSSAKLGCQNCHGGQDFNTPSGHQSRYQNNQIYFKDDYMKSMDKGLFGVTKDSLDIGKFRVPSLRNIAATAPYMHDGSLANLNAVIKHYSKCNGTDSMLKGFTLSEKEQRQLISFLEALTDSSWNQKIIFNKPNTY